LLLHYTILFLVPNVGAGVDVVDVADTTSFSSCSYLYSYPCGIATVLFILLLLY